MSSVETFSQFAAIGGYVSDANTGAGIGGATVELVDGDAQTQARADGFYCFLDLAEGSYTLHASAPAAGSRYGTVTVADVAVARAANGNPVLDAAANLGLPPTRLTGSVRRSDTLAPVAYAEVLLRASKERVRSAKSGQYALSAVEAGTQTVQISAPGFNVALQTVTLTAGQETVVDFDLTPE